MSDATHLWPHSPAIPETHWGFLAGELGADPKLLRPFLIGIRGAMLRADETHATRSRAVYDDSFVLLQAQRAPFEFRGATHAYQLLSKASPDVNGDGVGDVATINPGRFVLTWKMDDAVGCPVFELTLPDGGRDIPAARDVNHDGIAEAGPYTADSVLFHTGYDAPDGAAHSSSIACQTAHLSSLKQMKQAGHMIDYVMRDAEELIPMMAAFYASLQPGNVA